MKLMVWMASNRLGEFLCKGNMNANLMYHLCYPNDCNYLSGEQWIMCRTKWEIGLHIKKWHSALDSDLEKRGMKFLANSARCRPVKMVVSWEPATKGGVK